MAVQCLCVYYTICCCYTRKTKELSQWFSIAMYIACINYFDDSIRVHHICACLQVPCAQTAAAECVASKVTPDKFHTNFDLIHMWDSF